MRTAASDFDRLAEQLSKFHVDGSAKVNALAWTGSDADRYRDMWGDEFGEDVMYAATLVRDLAVDLRLNADHQDSVSSSLTATSGLMQARDRAYRVIRWLAREQSELARQRELQARWWESTGHEQADRMADASPEAQRAWWTSLTPQQQTFILAAYPGFLVGMAGLDATVRDRARQQIREDFADDVVLNKETTEASLEVHVPVYKVNVDLGAEGSASISEMANGKYVVDLELTGKLGASVSAKANGSGAEVGVALEGSVSQQYEFNSRAEADEFLAGLRKAVVPDKGEMVQGVFRGSNWLMADSARDGYDYLSSRSGNLTETEIEGKITSEGSVSVKAGANSVEVAGGAGIGVRHNTGDGTTTFFAERSLSAKGSFMGVAGSASLESEVSLVTKDGSAHELVISGTFKGTAGADLAAMTGVSEVATLNAQAGLQGSVEMRIALDDPIVANRASDLISRVLHGEPGALDAMKSLYRHTEITLQLDNVVTTEAGFDAEVVEGRLTTTSATNQMTLVKPVGSTSAVEY